MTLFGSIQLGGNTLQAMQIGLQVVGNNIANANTPGYVRQEAVYVPAGVQKQGSLILGLGVKVDSIIQKIDKFVQDRLVGARGDRANAEMQEKVYRDLETLLNELSETGDLSSSMTSFFNAVDEVLKDPGDAGKRNLAVNRGISLASDINNLQSRVATVKLQLDQRVSAASDEINSLTEQIRVLNVQIAAAEGGDSSASQAGGLRVTRQNAIDRLSELVGITVSEQPSGGLSITVGGEYLVFEGQRREVAVNADRGTDAAAGIIEFVGTQSPVLTTTGELQGLYKSRDEIVGGFLKKFDDFAAKLAFEFNKIYSQGQGLVGFSQLTSHESVASATAALDEAGLAFTPVSGTFDILIRSKDDDPLKTLSKTHTIRIDLDGLDDDTTLASLAQQLNAVDGISVSINSSGQLVIKSASADIDFAFSGDTSGVLAALGLNTFFTGSTAATLGVNGELKGIENAGKFAASLGGIGEDSRNAERLSTFLSTPLESAGNASLSDLYNQLLNEVTQGSAVSKSVADGYRTFEGSLQGQAQAVSGVSIDEEAITMMTLQRIYQASAKYIQTISDLLELMTRL